MKKFNKVMALVLSVAVVLAMSVVPAFAASITLKAGDTHTYAVFQVLTGTLSEAGSKQLGNPEWGSNAIENPGDVNEFISSITATGLSEAEVANLVAAKVDTTGNPVGQVTDGHPATGLATGYYVLVDVTDLDPDKDGKTVDTKSLHVVKVLNDATMVNIKYGTTEDSKVITGDTLGEATADKPRNPDTESMDNVSIGDTVNFQITATIPANANLYNYFYFVINDTLDEGLTLNENSIKVYKDSVNVDNLLSAEGSKPDYQVKTGDAASPKSFQVGLNDAKSLAGKDIIVTYSAVLNDKAKIGEVPNKNTSTVTFSNDPNHNYNGENNNPGFPNETDLAVTGETPASVTNTYTTGIEIQKVDENGDVLTGAEFTITGDSTEIVLVSSETFAEATNGEYYGLKNGTYTKEAPVEADYMKVAEPGATKGYVEDASADTSTDGVITVGGKTYRPVTADDTNKTVYILVKANADQYDGKRYNKTVTYTQKNTKANPTIEAKAEVGPDGVVRFVGLGAGDYTITETKTPSGYNTIQPITVSIDFDETATGDAPHWKKTAQDTSKATYNKNTGVFEITIENQKGTELPETGGIGTTIFYVLGAILVIGAGVLLVTRRRMNAN